MTLSEGVHQMLKAIHLTACLAALTGCAATTDTTFVAPTCAPVTASMWALEPSDRSHWARPASHTQFGLDADDRRKDWVVAGVPARTALASSGRSAKAKCSTGGAEWSASACARIVVSEA